MQVQTSIETKLNNQFKPSFLNVINESHKHHVPKNSETHFLVVVVSKTFELLTRIQRQRAIHECLTEELKGPVHALSMKLFTDEEWQKLSDKSFTTPNCAH